LKIPFAEDMVDMEEEDINLVHNCFGDVGGESDVWERKYFSPLLSFKCTIEIGKIVIFPSIDFESWTKALG
jgi:hypothetical protein